MGGSGRVQAAARDVVTISRFLTKLSGPYGPKTNC